MPMPPSTAWLIAPARLAMRLTVTTEPSRPNKIEERAPAKKALRTNGKSGETRAEKKWQDHPCRTSCQHWSAGIACSCNTRLVPSSTSPSGCWMTVWFPCAH